MCSRLLLVDDTTRAELERTGRAWLADEQGFNGEPRLAWSVDMRYRGQSYEIEVPVERTWISAGDTEKLADAFHREHERVYEYADPKAPVQAINLRLVVSAPAAVDSYTTSQGRGYVPVPDSMTNVFYDGAWHEAGIYDRSKINGSAHLVGPAIIRQDDCTTCIVGGYQVDGDLHLNLRIRPVPAKAQT